MQFSSRLPIAIHILLVIYTFKDEYKLTSDFIASSVGVNPVTIRNILGQLKAADLVDITAGVGGAALKKSLDEITFYDVFQAVEEDRDLFHIHENPNPNCAVGKNIHKILDGKLNAIKIAMNSKMKEITLSSLLL